MRNLVPAFLLIFILSVNAQKKRPNILFIYTDDQSSRTVSCYPESFKWVKTPNIDTLALEGVRFEQAYIGTWCMPSRASMLTGYLQHNVPSLHRVGTYPNVEYDPEVLQFWPKVFRKNGYTTAHIGKWHLGQDTGYGRDWDYQVVWNRPEMADKTAGTYYLNQKLSVNGKSIGNVDAYATDNYTDYATKFIKGENRNKENPWFLWLCYTGVHGPFTPADRHLNSYEDIKVPVPKGIFPPRKGKPEYVREQNYWKKDKDGLPVRGRKSLEENVRQYHQAVLAIDENIGKLVKALKETGQYENTLIVYTSDQGLAKGQHGFLTKHAPYAGTIKAPLIVSMPSKIAKGKVSNSPVNGVDLIPTFFSFAGINLPWEMDGTDMSAILKEPGKVWDKPLLMTYTHDKFRPDTAKILKSSNKIPWYSFVLKDGYKFIQTFVEDEVPELYDLENDPEEINNLALDPEFHNTVIKYHKILVNAMRKHKVKFVDELPKMKGFSE